jgi:ribosomal protein L39E
MSSRKTSGKKIRLIKAQKQTKWAPFWLIPKVFGVGRKVHPSRLTRKKRNWRRNRVRA